MYKKYVKDGILIYIGVDCAGIDISKEEYQILIDKINNIPVAPSGYQYVIRDVDKEYILIPLEPPPIDDTDDDATESDYIYALQDLGVEIET